MFSSSKNRVLLTLKEDFIDLIIILQKLDKWRLKFPKRIASINKFTYLN